MDSNLPSLDALQDRIHQASPAKEPHRSAAMEYNKDMSLALRFLVELVAGIAVGAGLGFAADRWLDSQPIGLLFGLMLGLAAAIRNMMRSAKHTEEASRPKE